MKSFESCIWKRSWLVSLVLPGEFEQWHGSGHKVFDVDAEEVAQTHKLSYWFDISGWFGFSYGPQFALAWVDSLGSEGKSLVGNFFISKHTFIQVNLEVILMQSGKYWLSTWRCFLWVSVWTNRSSIYTSMFLISLSTPPLVFGNLLGTPVNPLVELSNGTVLCLELWKLSGVANLHPVAFARIWRTSWELRKCWN